MNRPSKVKPHSKAKSPRDAAIEESSEPKRAVGLKRMINASRYSYRGLVFSFKHEASFRGEVFAAAVLLPLALWLDVTLVERILLVCSVFMVLIVELVNTGIEAIVDRVGLERHVLAGAAKDVGSAAVLLTLIMGAFIWGCILIPPFL